MNYLVTVKLDKNSQHDPKNKVTEQCPLSSMLDCSDQTGQHHTFVCSTDKSLTEVQSYWETLHHVTRVERVDYMTTC